MPKLGPSMLLTTVWRELGSFIGAHHFFNTSSEATPNVIALPSNTSTKRRVSRIELFKKIRYETEMTQNSTYNPPSSNIT